MEKTATDKIYLAIEEEKPDVVIQLGDAYDMYSYSKFARSHDICTPKEELQEARQGILGLWDYIHKIAPSARLMQMSGNHEARIMKRVLDRFPEIASILNTEDIFKVPNVETYFDHTGHITIEGVVYTHGFLTKLGDHCKHFGCPVVHGHTHRGGTIFYKTLQGVNWELDCGFLADESQVPLQYGAIKHTMWTLGYGIVDKWGPRFIPLWRDDVEKEAKEKAKGTKIHGFKPSLVPGQN